MIRAILLRHGQTHDNVRRVWPHDDVGLTEKGVIEAEAAGDIIADGIGSEWDMPRFVFASPLRRTLRTAQIAVTRFGFEPDDVFPLNLLRERDFGPLVGEPSDPYLKATGGHNYAELDTVPGVEPLSAVHQRAGRAIAFLEGLVFGSEDNPTVVVVSHKALLRGMQFEYAGLPYDAVYGPEQPVGPRNADVMVLDIQ